MMTLPMSQRGVLNDGEGCLTTHLSDIALFIDGRIPATFSVDKARASMVRSVFRFEDMG